MKVDRPRADRASARKRDARVAEAHALGAGAGGRPGRPVDGERLDARWARNVMLNKWLEYCVDRGHRFAGGGA